MGKEEKGMGKLNKIIKKILATILIAVLVAGGLSGCSSKTKDTVVKPEGKNTNGGNKNQKTGTANDSLKPIRLGVGGQGNNYSMELANLAYKNGYLEEELKKAGYSLELQAFLQTGPEVNAAMASGTLDGAIYGDFPVFTSNSNGIASTVVAVVNQKTEYGIVVAGDDIKKPKDLEGKRVIIVQGTVMQYFWEHYVAANKLDESKIGIINSTNGDSLLQTGEADAYVCIMNTAKRMESKGIGKIFADSSQVPDGGTVGVVTLGNKFLAENPEAAVAINKALLRAFDDATANLHMHS